MSVIILRIFRYRPLNTFLHKLDPRVKFMWLFTMLIPALAWSDPIFLSFTVLMVILSGLIAQERVKDMLKVMLTPFPGYVMIILFNLLFFDTTVKMRINWKPYYLFDIWPTSPFGGVSVESLVFSLGVCLRLAVIVSASRLFLTIASPSDVVMALSKLRAPTEFSTTVSVAFGYLPEMVRQVVSIIEAQKSRGWKLRTKNPIKAVKQFIPVIVPVISRSIVRSEYLAAAMVTRGLGYSKKRTSVKEVKFTARDAWTTVILLTGIVAASIIGIWGIGVADFKFTSLLIRQFLT